MSSAILSERLEAWDVFPGPSALEVKFRDLCLPVLENLQLRLYDLKYNDHSGYLKLFIMHEENQSADLQDCVRVDHALTPFLEKEQWVPEKLTLEVSSPGVFRELNLPWHFKKAEGHPISVHLKDSLDTLNPDVPKMVRGNKKFKAKLLALRESDLQLEMKGHEVLVPLNLLKRANMELESE